MATLRQYFETDFNYAIRVHICFIHENENVEAVLLYDVSAYTAFLSCFIPGLDKTYDYFLNFLKMLEHGRTKLNFSGKITLPSIRQFPGKLQVKKQVSKEDEFEIQYSLFGDPEWKSTKNINATGRVFIYSESPLRDIEVIKLQRESEKLGHKIQFRSQGYVSERTKFEMPLAFISHDSRDKEEVAKPIAINLQRMLCPVWYDEFSLKVGDNLRESIEKGLKECKKCILILSPNFFSNKGWTKREFDSIFTREILEESRLVLPVWHGVTKEQVYDFSPSLLNVKGLDWKKLGELEVSRLLHNAILEQDNV